MNSFELKCYQQTYQNPQYWDNTSYSTTNEQKEEWATCRAVTDKFFDELIRRGYLVRRN